MITNRIEAVKKARQAHRQNIQRILEHRLQVATDKGDDKLIKQLEAEFNYPALPNGCSLLPAGWTGIAKNKLGNASFE
ncbi:MAG: hypothetical protein QNJ47_01470 [Nostocaceae cyanobacterium]|nr:hypothetical protein [Nostocaceae cyanobacterium]